MLEVLLKENEQMRNSPSVPSEELSAEGGPVLGRRGHNDVPGHEQRVRSPRRQGTSNTKRRQGIFWLLTVPYHEFTPWLPPGCRWIKGQLELGAGGFLHWQTIVALRNKGSLSTVKLLFGTCHAELSRSSAASDYVWKELTRVEGTQFEIGEKPCDPSSQTDW